jgi:hypothetical protein
MTASAALPVKSHALILLLVICAPAAHAAGCVVPDEGESPYRRAVTKVQLLPETEEWVASANRRGATLQFAVLLDRPIEAAGRCHWTVEASADGRLWGRFFVSPDGRSVLAEGPSGEPISLEDWRGVRR